MESGSIFPQFTNVVRTIQNAKHMRPYAVHGMVAVMILATVSLSGQMTDYAERNASRIIKASNTTTSETTSAYVAANVADGLGMSLAGRVSSDAENLDNQQQLMAADDTHLSKVSAVATDDVSRDDIVTYTVKRGDSVAGVAKKFNITTQTLRWANDLSEQDALSRGDELTIPPVDGVLHTVEAGDTAKQLADHYQANATQIISMNDAEVDGLPNGENIIIPDGVLPESERPQYTPTPINNYIADNFTSQYSGNSYIYGYCTWYVASRIDVPSNWGNATRWDDFAASSSGWSVTHSPQPGAIAQHDFMAGGLGHVAIVEEVSPDGSQIRISDMNGVAGFGIEGTSDWISASKYKYIVSN